MAAKKLDFSMDRNGHTEPVKARIFEGHEGRIFAQLDGGIFNGWQPNLTQLDQVIEILQDVREAVRKESLYGKNI